MAIVPAREQALIRRSGNHALDRKEGVPEELRRVEVIAGLGRRCRWPQEAKGIGGETLYKPYACKPLTPLRAPTLARLPCDGRALSSPSPWQSTGCVRRALLIAERQIGSRFESVGHYVGI